VKEKRRQKIDLGVIIYHALKAQGYMQISLYIYIYIYNGIRENYADILAYLPYK